MAFWGSQHQNTTYKDPKRKFRFIVQMDGIETALQDIQGSDSQVSTAEVWYAKTVTRPSFTISATEHKYLNHTFYYPGLVTWNTITMTMADPQDPNVAMSLSKIINDKAGYKVPFNQGILNTISKANAVTALGGLKIRQLDADGKDIEIWTLYNAFITDVKYGDLSYGDEELVELSIDLRYDWASVESADGSEAYFDGKE